MTVVTFFVILDASGAGPVCFVPDRPIDERNRATSQNQGTGTAGCVRQLRGHLALTRSDDTRWQEVDRY